MTMVVGLPSPSKAGSSSSLERLYDAEELRTPIPKAGHAFYAGQHIEMRRKEALRRRQGIRTGSFFQEFEGGEKFGQSARKYDDRSEQAGLGRFNEDAGAY